MAGNAMRKTLLTLVSAAVLAAPVAASEADAVLFSEAIRQRFTPYSTIVAPEYNELGGWIIINFTRCGDSALWTGYWLAAESFRWNVTRSPEARANVMEALNGIRKLVDVTGNDLLARCAMPANSPWAKGPMEEEKANGIYKGIVDGQEWQWAGNTSRDQYVGVFFGLTAAWNLVGEQGDQEVRDWVSMLATRLLNRLLAGQWIVRMPNGEISTTFLIRPDQQLGLLKLGKRCNGGEFARTYDALANAIAPSVIAPILVDNADEHSSYFKFNLNYATLWNLRTSGDNGFLERNYQAAFDALRNRTKDHQNPFFNLVDRAINGADNPARDQEAVQLLDEWLVRERRDYTVDLRGKYPSCGEDRSCVVIPVRERINTDFLWQRSPFQLYQGGTGRIETPSIDYILPYWMGRFYGVIRP